MKRAAVISAILEDPKSTQQQFNDTIAEFRGIVRGRMGIPMDDLGIAVISLTVVATMDELNSLTGKLGAIPQVSVKTAVGKKEFE